MGRHQSRVESRLLDLLNHGDNANKCGECGSTYPTWASCNLGIFLCGRCASMHRKLGSDISRVKSLSLDNWTDSEVDRLALIGNRRAKAIWNPKKVQFPLDDDDNDTIEHYLREKYIDGKFRYDPIDPREYDDRSGGHHKHHSRSRRSSRYGLYDDEYADEDEDNGGYGSRNGYHSRSKSSLRRSRAHSRSGPPPRLTHRTPSLAEKQKYYLTSYRLARDTGLDQDLIIEALSITNGDSKLAMEAVQLDSQYGGSRESTAAAPPLPRRRENILMSDKTGVQSSLSSQNGGNFDWMSSSPPAQGSSLQTNITGAVSSTPQLQPFLDQATGMVVYVDSVTGQQYVDPNGAAQLQQQQQQQQQLQQQYTSGVDKGTILSLYQRPDLYSSLVAMTDQQKLEIQNQLQQIQLQQQQQLSQQQLQQLPMDQQQQYLYQQQLLQQQQQQLQQVMQQQGYWG